MPSPNPKDSINQLNRNEQVTIFRLGSLFANLGDNMALDFFKYLI